MAKRAKFKRDTNDVKDVANKDRKRNKKKSPVTQFV